MKKLQKTKIGVSGSFINQLMGNNSSVPKVGQGATMLHYSDRTPYEVIDVSQDGKKCEIRRMKCNFIGESYGDEKYTYESNPNAQTITLEWNNKKSCWGIRFEKFNKVSIIFGVMEKYRDPHF